jgi:ribonuclease HII
MPIGRRRQPCSISWLGRSDDVVELGSGGVVPMSVRSLIAGVDEAGRGPLAGPVVAAAVILDPVRPIEGLCDSKLLSRIRRTALAREIRCNARAFALGLAHPAEIDAINVLRASLLAMERAVARLRIPPELVLVDGNQLPGFAGGTFVVEGRVGGDATVPCISAASILAKVCRDRLMLRWHRQFPNYAFDRNMGYPTRVHLARLERHGPCAIHRASFAPVRKWDRGPGQQ